MPIAISLAQFNSIASGKFNAGEVDLATNDAGEFTGELVKINNHILKTRQNNVELSGERVLKIKETFISALESAHVDGDNLRAIREEPGLPSEMGTDHDTTAMLEKRYTPLSREKIRHLLDTYANQGRGFEGGEGGATDAEVRHADRTRNMSESKQEKRDRINRQYGAKVTTGIDKSIVDTIRLMTGGSLEGLNKKRIGQITGENAVNERAKSTTVLTNSFTKLYTELMNILPAEKRMSAGFRLLGQDAQLVKADDGTVSVLLGKGESQIKLNLGKDADALLENMMTQAVESSPFLGNEKLRSMMEQTYGNDLEGFMVAGDRTSLSRKLASLIVMNASMRVMMAKASETDNFSAPPNTAPVDFASVMNGDYDTESLVEVALNAIEHGEKVATKQGLDDFHNHIREFNSALTDEMKVMLGKVMDLPIEKRDKFHLLNVSSRSLVKDPQKILDGIKVGGERPVDPNVTLADVKDFVADMVYSDDTIFLEIGNKVDAGAKMREALTVPGRAAVLAELIKNLDILYAAVSDEIVADVKSGMEKFIAVLDKAFKAANNGESLKTAAAKEGFTARLEAFLADSQKISNAELARLPMIMQAMAIKGCEKLQTFINKVFSIKTDTLNDTGGITTNPYEKKSAADIAKELKEKSLEQILDDASNADNVTPGQIGLFKQVMSQYFTGMGRSDKKTIFAAALKYADTFDFKGLQGDALETAKTKATSKFVGAILKGTSPLMQKMMQGMPKSIMGPFSAALDDMKSKLAPIPRKIVQAHLYKMIEDSQKKELGRITNIEVNKSLGAASVGEAFSCTITYIGKTAKVKNPYGDLVDAPDPDNADQEVVAEIRKDVVIKIMRPDAEERVKREAKIFTDAAKKIGNGMLKTWEGQLNQYMTEFDFTTEARNVEIGKELYEVVENEDSPYRNLAPSVRSMSLNPEVKTTKNALVCDIARGSPVDRFVASSRENVRSQFAQVFVTDSNTGKPIEKPGLNGKPTRVLRKDININQISLAKNTAVTEYQELIRAQKMLVEAGKVWFSEAFLASGKFHADAHAGNLILSNQKVENGGGITFIDFGNLYQLNTAAPVLDSEGKPVIDETTHQPKTINERVELLRIILGTTLRNDTFVLQGVKNLLSPAGKEALEANRDKAEAIVKAILDKGNFSFHACYRMQAILSELQKLGLELPPQINCFIQSMVRMQNMLAEMNDLIAEIKDAIDIFRNCPRPEGMTEPDEHDFIGQYIWNMTDPKGQEDVPEIDSFGDPVMILDAEGNPTDKPATVQRYVAEANKLVRDLQEPEKHESTARLIDRLEKSEDPAALIRSLYEKALVYYSDNPPVCNSLKRVIDETVKRINEASPAQRKSVLTVAAQEYLRQQRDFLSGLSFSEVEFQRAKIQPPASFAQVIMGVVFAGGAAMDKMYNDNFNLIEQGKLALSAKSISTDELGGRTFEFKETTRNRIVKAAQLLGAHHSKNVKVDDMKLPE